jgi:hypothetical protein
MLHLEILGLFFTIIAGIYTIDSKIERLNQSTNERIDKQCERSDKLYEMFIDLIKEGKK